MIKKDQLIKQKEVQVFIRNSFRVLFWGISETGQKTIKAVGEKKFKPYMKIDMIEFDDQLTLEKFAKEYKGEKIDESW